MTKNQLRNSTESNRAKNRLSAPSAQPTGLAARLGRAPCRTPVPPIAPTPTRPAPAYEPRALSHAPHAQPSAQLPYAQWAVAHFRFCILFFFLCFFHFFQPLENTKKYIYLFSFIFQYTNKFIKIYFIYIIIIFLFPNKPNKLLKFILFIFLL